MEQVNINVTKVEQDVTINATPNVTQIIVTTQNGGGTQNLNDVLSEGNATDGENIFISNGDEITFDNGSRIRKGLTDAGNGGAQGVALVCSLDYELKWEAGRQYVMQQDGFTIREVSHNFTITPSATDDITKGFAIDSRWILDNGDVYVCTDATEDSAIWELQVTDVQDLQNVTDIGNATTNPILIPELQLYDSATDAYAKISYSDGQFDFRDINGRIIKVIEKDGLEQTLNQNDFTLTKEISSLTANRTRTEPNKDGTYAMLSDIPDVTGFVPYTGANQNVNLGENGLKAGQLTLDITPTGTAEVGTTRWNDTIGSSETTLKGGNVILKNGVDLVARIVNKVTPNTTLTKASYQVVRISGAQGQRLAVNLAQANNDNNSADTLGVVCETIATNQQGFIMTVGQLENINTTGSLQGETWSDGDVLYLSPTTAGRLTNVKPIAPAHIVIVGYVEYAHANNGKIYVKIMNGWELDELHNVAISTPLNNQGLIYETSTDLWKNKTIIEDSITNGVTTIAPSQNAVFDALALKQNVLTNPITGTGANGQVAFFNGATTQAGDNGLFWDNTNKRLGIGTTTPTTRLDVRAQGALSTDIAFRVRNSADTADLISVNGIGRVGIGLASPAGKLDVFDSTDSSIYCRIGSVGANWQTGTTLSQFGTFTNHPLVFKTNDQARMRIDASGNVLINTTTTIASSRLTVESTTQGVLLPRMTNAQRLAIASPAVGLIVYCTDMVEGLYVNKSTGWQFII
jgi:nitrogen fixation protein